MMTSPPETAIPVTYSVSARIAGWSGVLAGVGLLVEGVLWSASGWTADTFDDPAAALDFLAEGGGTLRYAVFAGFVNLVFLVVFTAGLAGRLRARTPALASMTLWFGMIGIAAHAIVPMAHWYGVPAFLEAAERDPEAARSAWTAFVTVGHDAAGGMGAVFMGLSLLVAGVAMARRRELPVLLGWTALVTGAISALTLFEPDTALSGAAGVLFPVSLGLTVIVRTWAGIALLRAE